MRSSNTSRRHALPYGLGSLAWLLWITTITPCYAIDPDRAMSQYVRDHFGAEQGFPRGPVYAITQTADGYLWIGTEAGLVRFDGWTFSLTRDKSGALGMTSVLGLEPDADGSLWVRLRDLSLVRYRNGVFDQPRTEPYSNVTAMTRSNSGEVAVWQMEDGAFVHAPNGFQRLAAANDLPRTPVISLALSADGAVWMGTRDAGLFRSEGGKTAAIRKGLPDSKVNCLLAASDRDLWVGTDDGIVRWNGSELNPVAPASLRHFQALAIARDRDANIWVGTDSHGLLRFNERGVSSLDDTLSGPREAVTAVFEDREGNLWTGSASGLDRLRDSAFVTYSQPEGLPTDGTNPIFVDQENRMWFAPVSGGLWWVKDVQHGHLSQGGLGQDAVYSIAGGNGEIWVGRRRGGLSRTRLSAGGATVETYTQANGLAQNSVYSVYRTRDGSVWAGTLSGGVSKWSGGRFTTYAMADGLASNMVASILETSDGAMWFATPSGLSRLFNGAWKTYTVREGLPSDNVNCLLEDGTGVLWIGTTAGLGFGASGAFRAVGGPASLHEQILGLAEDRQGSLWMATSSHVVRVKRDKLWRNTLTDGDIREFGLADGLRGGEGVKRHRSVVADSLGRIWFSMNRGISVVDPARLARRALAAVPHIESITADGKPIDTAGPVRISAKQQRVVISYAGLNLSVPERVRFRFTLEGFERTWSDPVARREATYTNLTPGPYRFRVMASNAEGVWGKEQAAIGFEILPLFWQTWWFRLSSVTALAIVIAVFYWLRLQRLAGQLHVRFEERLAERTRIAQELHDTLLQGFLSASMQLHVAVDQLPSDSPAKPRLERVLEMVGQVIDEGRNAVRGLRSSHSSSLDLEEAFAQVQQELSLRQEVDFRIVVEGERRPLRPLLRDEVYRIGREALVNAFRHSQGKSVELEIDYAPKQLRLLVRDNGVGIDPQVLRLGRDGHWGMQGMRERAERIGGRLKVWSSAKVGTEVELSIPKHLAFQGPPGRRRFSWLNGLHSNRRNK